MSTRPRRDHDRLIGATFGIVLVAALTMTAIPTKTVHSAPHGTQRMQGLQRHRPLSPANLSLAKLSLAPLSVVPLSAPGQLISPTEQRVVDLVNAERRRVGVPPLIVNYSLQEAAWNHNEVMARTGCATHRDCGDGDPESRIFAAGYLLTYWSENLGQGQTSPEMLLRDWLGVPGDIHGDNVRHPNAADIGVAHTARGTPLSRGGSGDYWTVDFASHDACCPTVTPPGPNGPAPLTPTPPQPTRRPPPDVPTSPASPEVFLPIAARFFERRPSGDEPPPAGDCPGAFGAEYFPNRELAGLPWLRTCDTWPIHHEWNGTGGPGNGIGDDDFSVRWTGQLYMEAGTVTFVAVPDDGVRVWVDGSLIIDEWRDPQSGVEYRASRWLAAGWHDVRIEYYEASGATYIRVWWEQAVAEAPSPTPETAPQCTNPVVEGDFEGDGQAWQGSAGNHHRLVGPPGLNSTAAAQLAAYDNAQDILVNGGEIPTVPMDQIERVTIHWAMGIVTDETRGNADHADRLYIGVQGDSADDQRAVFLSEDTEVDGALIRPQQWLTLSATITDLWAQGPGFSRARLLLAASTNGSRPTAFGVDDVSLEYCLKSGLVLTVPVHLRPATGDSAGVAALTARSLPVQRGQVHRAPGTTTSVDGLVPFSLGRGTD